MTVTIPRPVVELTASDTFVVPSVGKSIGFTAAVVPDVMWGRVIPRQVLRWRWAPDGGTETTISCAMTCGRTLNQPGTMYVDIRVNGQEVTGSVRIHAEELKLVGVPDTVFPGENIAYTASTRFGTAISNGAWQWNGAPPAKGSALTSPQCVPGSTTCTVETFEAGEMVFTGTVAGVQMSASDSAVVTPCPPSGDHRLDDPGLVKGLMDAAAAGNPSAPNGLTGPGSRMEQYVVVVQRNDSSHYVYNATDTVSATACTIGNSQPPTQFPEPGTIVADGHSHTGLWTEPVYGCPPVQLPNGTILYFKKTPTDSGQVRYKSGIGASGVDTAHMNKTQLDHYLVEPRYDMIFKLDPANPQPGLKNPNRWLIGPGVCTTKIQ